MRLLAEEVLVNVEDQLVALCSAILHCDMERIQVHVTTLDYYWKEYGIRPDSFQQHCTPQEYRKWLDVLTQLSEHKREG